MKNQQRLLLGLIISLLSVSTGWSQITISNTLVHATAGQSDGSIDLTVSGGTPGYTYSWSNSSSAEDPAALAAGTYTVTVTDGASATATATIEVGTYASWVRQVNASPSGTTLSKTNSSNNFDGGAVSSQVLKAGETGWVEFVPGALETKYVGLVRPGMEANHLYWTNYEFYVVLSSTGAASIRGTGFSNDAFTYTATDILRFERNGSTGIATLYKNGTAVLSSSTGYTGQLALGAVLLDGNSSLQKGAVSNTHTQPTVVHTQTNVTTSSPNTGAINITVAGGSGPYTYSWSNSVSSEDLTGLSAQDYTVTVTDNNGVTVVRTIGVGYDVSWTDVSFADVVGTTITNRRASSTPYSGGASAQVLEAGADGWIEFPAGVAERQFIGFTDAFDGNPLDVAEYEVYLQLKSNGTALFYANGVYTSLLIGYEPDDIIRMERNGTTGVFTLSVNGHEYHSTTYVNTGALILATQLYEGLGSQADARTSFSTTPPVLVSSVTNLSAEGASDGQITLTPTGDSPFTYTWSNGSSAQHQSSLVAGIYTVTVTDYNSLTSTTAIGVGYDLQWATLTNATETNHVITKSTSGDDFSAGGLSNQVLEANTGGWAEMEAGIAEAVHLGLIDPQTSSFLNKNNYAFRLFFTGNSFVAAYEGTTLLQSAPYEAGDVFRIERDGTTGLVSFTRNGAEFAASTSANFDDLKVGAILYDGNSSINHVRSSFTGSPPKVDIAVTALGGSSTTDGELDLTVTGNGSFSYDWSDDPTNTNQDRTGLTYGVYTVTVTDAFGLTHSSTVSMGPLVDWTTLGSATYSNGLLSSTATADGWNASAYSDQLFAANRPGWMEFTVDATDETRMFGFQDMNYSGSATDPNGLAFGVYLHNTGFGYVYEGSQAVGGAFTYAQGDVLKIERLNDNKCVFYLNGTPLRESDGQPTYALKGQALFHTAQATFEDIRYSANYQYAARTAITDESRNGPGALEVDVYGGAPPYQILFDPNDYISGAFYRDTLQDTLYLDSITYENYLNLAFLDNFELSSGEYEVHVIDTNQDTIILPIQIGCDLNWDSEVGVTSSGAVLAKSSLVANWTSSYAETDNILGTERDGKLSFVLGNTGASVAVGFKEPSKAIGSGYEDLQFAFKLENTSIAIWEAGSLISNVGTYQPDNVLSIERSGTHIIYKQNGTVLRDTDYGSRDEELTVGAFLGSLGAEVHDIKLFNTHAHPVFDTEIVDLGCGEDQTGSIDLARLTAPYGHTVTYEWRDENQAVISTASNATGLSPGNYTVIITVSDPSGPYSMTYDYLVGYKINWSGFVNTQPVSALDNNSLIRTSANPTQNGTAQSLNSYDPTVGNSEWIAFRMNPQHAGHWSEVGFYDMGGTNDKIGIRNYFIGTNFMVLETLDDIGSSSGQSFMNPIDPGSILKVERLGSGDINVHVDDFVWSTQLSLASATGNLAAIAELGTNSQDVVWEAVASFGCPQTDPFYVKLKRRLDGGYYHTLYKKLYFQYDEEYEPGTGKKLQYNIYDEARTLVGSVDETGATLGSSPNPLVAFGDNRYEFSFVGMGLNHGKYYTLEVINNKGEKQFLKFLYQN